MASSCRVDTKMKLLVVLSLLGLVAAEPQVIMPYTTPFVTPTYRTIGNPQALNTYTASYPYTGFPSIQAALPTTYSNKFFTTPFVTTGSSPFGTTIVSSRQKRSADPEPEADPALLYTTGIANPAVSTFPWSTLPATNIPYNTLPAAVSLYSNPQAFRTTGFTYTAPFVNNLPVVSPYSAFPIWSPIAPTTQVISTPTAAEPAETPAARTKRSAEPEADPQLLTTGFTGFTYPAVNTRTLPSALTYSNIPSTFSGSSNWPITYTSGFPYNFGNYPAATTYIAG